MELNELHPNSLAARDYAQQQTTPDVAEMYEQASAESGKPVSQMLREAAQGSRWPGMMTRLDYILHRLYELDKAERKDFISDWAHWPIHEFTKDDEWSDKTVDKWQCTDILTGAGIPTIPILAVVDRSDASYGETPKIGSVEELRDLLSSADFPLFAKPNNLLGSFGAFRITALADDKVVVNNGDQVPLDQMIEEFMADVPYVLQHVVTNHASIREFADGLATLRTVNLVKSGEVRMERGVFKIPVGGNIADNAWRDGNLVANVDPVTGVIDRVVRGVGPGMRTFTEHPDTGTQLVGMELPCWSEAVALNERTAQLFSTINYQSLDIALTDDGPIIVEVNSGSSFALPQQASGRGFLTKENKKFFESCGVNFRKLPAPG